jgi:methylenetetrahydrofolate--tRNA-(uracil-5-)-methyltransferase
MREYPNLFFAGQMTGVEGYIESCGSGFVAGLNAARRALGMDEIVFPRHTMLGAMSHYVSEGGGGKFVPMNANFGILAPLPIRIKDKKERYKTLAQRALQAIRQTIGE